MPQPFIDISFPPYVAKGATGGPSYSTSIVSLASGREQRNALWAHGRGRWNIGTGIRSRAEMQAVIAHFHVVMGRAWSFRFKDWNDYQASNQTLVSASATVWQLVKRYAVGGHEHVRTITKPVAGTVVVKVGASVVTPADIDHSSGLVSFADAPASTPTASFEFDVPVRFDSDTLPVQANAWDQQEVSQIELIEVLE